MHQLGVPFEKVRHDIEKFHSLLRCPHVLYRIEGDVQVGEADGAVEGLEHHAKLADLKLAVAQV